MSPQEFIFRHNLINYLEDVCAEVHLNNKDIDDWTLKDIDGVQISINPKEIYQDFLQSSKSASEFCDSVYHSIEYELNNEKENENLALEI